MDATFECRVFPAALTPGAFAPCSSGASHTASGFAPGVYTFETRATDAVGNVESTSVKRTFTVTDPPPVVTPDPPADNGGGGGTPTTPGAQVTTTTTTTVGSQILATLAFGFSNSTKTSTKLTSLIVKNVPAGSTVTAKCPKGCAKKSVKKTNASGQVSLSALIKKPLKVNTVITVTVSKPGSSSGDQDPQDPPAQGAPADLAVPARRRLKAHHLLNLPPGTTAAQQLSCAAEPL